MASIQKRANGSWRARYRDAAGKEHARHFARKVDAQRWLDEISALQLTGAYVDPAAGKMTFREWFAEWSSMQIWAPGTTDAANRAVAGIPFADVPLGRITSSDVQGWIKAMETKGLAETTIRARYSYVHMAFRAAVGDRIIRDPSKLRATGGGAGVTLPKLPRATKLTIPEASQVAKVMAGAAPHFRPFIGLCAFAGLRLGEAAGLQVRDIDFEGHRLHVQRQIQGNTNGASRVAAPKHGSDRWVPVPADLTAMLQDHVDGIGTLGDEGWLFASDAGVVFQRASAGREWHRAASTAGVTGFTLHSCRHFYASALIAAGCDVVTVQRALGHSSSTTTLKVYAHLWPDASDRTRIAAANVMREALAPADSLRTNVVPLAV